MVSAGRTPKTVAGQAAGAAADSGEPAADRPGAPATAALPAGEPGERPAKIRPRLWHELLLVGLCYLAYSMVRNLVPTDHALAAHRAYEILNIEGNLHIDMEYSLNRLFVSHAWLAIGADYFYATFHFIVTIGVLMWLYARHPDRYISYRSMLFATTMVGLAGFWVFPLAPPRMLPGFTDTVVSFGTWGIYDSGPGASISNQYAAMPSMHTAWSLWCAVAIIDVARRRWTAILAALYPATTVLVIMGTANHYILDAVGGGAALAAGFALSRGAFRVAAVARCPGDSQAP